MHYIWGAVQYSCYRFKIGDCFLIRRIAKLIHLLSHMMSCALYRVASCTWTCSVSLSVYKATFLVVHVHMLWRSSIFSQGRSIVRVCESLSKLHEYISSSELKLPSSTVSLEEDLKVSIYCTPLVAIFDWESTQYRIALVVLYFALWLGEKTRAIFSSNQIPNWNQLRLGRLRCPAL